MYKRKRPIRTDFVDFSELSARRAACEREVDLNRRLAPDAYLGVADMTLNSAVVDHFVVMRRFPEACRLSAMLSGSSANELVCSVAELIAAFHQGPATGEAIAAASGYVAVKRLWQDGIAAIERRIDSVFDVHEVARLALLVSEYLQGRQPLFDARIAAGCAVDGHGDLQAEDIFCCDDGPQVLDCLEFSDRLRFGDRLNDVAFLAMDLERLGHRELAETFLRRYCDASGAAWPRSLEHFYIAYRAHVRAKVACIRHDQGDLFAAEAARSLHSLALMHLEAGRVRLILVGGGPGTGKTNLSRALGAEMKAVVLSSDVLRDEIQPRVDARPDGELNAGRYESERVDAVYRELLDRARALLAMGESVILDASWLEPDRRVWARDLASEAACPITELRCVCSQEIAEQRIEDRVAAGTDASEATVDVARWFDSQTKPWTEAHDVSTERVVALAVDDALRFAAMP